MSKILIVSNAYPPSFIGGAELVAHEQAKNLVSIGHEVRVFAGYLDNNKKRYAFWTEYVDGITVERVNLSTEDFDVARVSIKNTTVEDHFAQILATFAPDILHCHNLLGLSTWLPVLGKEAGCKVVCTLHDHWGYCLRNTAVRADGLPCFNTNLCHECLPVTELPIRLRKDTLSFAFDHIDLFISPSEFLARCYKDTGMVGHRLTVLRNGIDTTRFQPEASKVESDTLRIAFVGHFGHHKGADVLLRSLALLPDRTRISLSLVGQGPCEQGYRALIDELELSSCVMILGRIAPSAMPALYAEIDLLIVPSVWGENQPVCIMEAMASGVPVIASDIGGIGEIIHHGWDGWLVPAGDAESLAAAINLFRVHRDLVNVMSTRCREKISELTHAGQLEKQIHLYHVVNDHAAYHKEVIGLKGEFTGRMGWRTRRLFGSRRFRDAYMIPLLWLSPGTQRHLRKVRRISREWRWVGCVSRWRRRLGVQIHDLATRLHFK